MVVETKPTFVPLVLASGCQLRARGEYRSSAWEPPGKMPASFRQQRFPVGPERCRIGARDERWFFCRIRKPDAQNVGVHLGNGGVTRK